MLVFNSIFKKYLLIGKTCKKPFNNGTQKIYFLSSILSLYFLKYIFWNIIIILKYYNLVCTLKIRIGGLDIFFLAFPLDMWWAWSQRTYWSPTFVFKSKEKEEQNTFNHICDMPGLGEEKWHSHRFVLCRSIGSKTP